MNAPLAETHPSLIENDLWENFKEGKQNMWLIEDIQKHTLDKKVIRDAIEKIFEKWWNNDWSDAAYMHSIRRDELLKELGLDGE